MSLISITFELGSEVQRIGYAAFAHLNCQGFPCQALLVKLSVHPRSPEVIDSQTEKRRSRIQTLEKLAGHDEHELVCCSWLFSQLRRFDTDLVPLT
jgi:hypothetical protein